MYRHEHLAEPTSIETAIKETKKTVTFVPFQINCKLAYNVIALLVMRFFQNVGNLDESFFWKTLENRYAAIEDKKKYHVNERIAAKIPLFILLNYVNRIQFHFL